MNVRNATHPPQRRWYSTGGVATAEARLQGLWRRRQQQQTPVVAPEAAASAAQPSFGNGSILGIRAGGHHTQQVRARPHLRQAHMI